VTGIIGLYQPGSTSVHRLPAGWKILAVFGGGTLVMLADQPVALAIASGCVGLLYGVARIPWRVALAHARPVVPVLALLWVAQWLTAGAGAATLGLLRLATVIMLAALVTLTTRMSEMVAVMEATLRPLRRVGVRTERVALAVSMTLRFIPLLSQVVHEVHEAQRARGLERNLLALAVPVVVRALHTAEQVADAIDARSHGSPSEGWSR
jgi:biotin transport system permease protein